MKKLFNKISIIVLISLLGNSIQAQPPGQWMWINGQQTPGSAGTYGTQGVPAAANTPAGLYQPCEWTDLNGNLWLFGGNSQGGSNNSLWRYSPATNQWTWVRGSNTSGSAGSYGTQGVPSPTNDPPSRGRGMATWTDNNNDLWMFGGTGTTPYSDLWKYNIAANQWTWMKGPNTPGVGGTYGTQGVPAAANNPGARCETNATWVDSNNDLWLFGGSDNGSGLFNDLWRYSTATNQWTWMKGFNGIGGTGSYGSQGVEAASNVPPPRMAYCRWTDNNGNFWLFAGGTWTSGNVWYNDMWRYNPSTGNWAWMSGSNLPNQTGIYNQRCQTSSSSIPGGRFENKIVWKDNSNNLYMQGGSQGSGLNPNWNDIWVYCITSNTWTYQNGDTIQNPVANFGTINVPSPNNKPDGRGGGCGWQDQQGRIYLFGGYGGGFRNDMWRYTPDPSCSSPCTNVVPVTIQASPDTVVCVGDCANIGAIATSGTTPYVYTWSPSVGTGPGPFQVCPTVTTTYTVIVTDGSGGTATDFVTITVNALPQAAVSPSGTTTLCPNDQQTFSATAGASYAYEWYRNNNPIPGANASSYTAATAGDYSVMITDQATGCSSMSAPSTLAFHIAPTASISPSGNVSVCPNTTVNLQANSGSGYQYVWYESNSTISGASSSSLSVSQAGSYSVFITDGNGCTATSTPTIVAYYSLPTATLSPTGTTTVCPNTTVTLQAGAGAGYTYEWYLNNTIISGASAATYDAVSSGNYQVKVTDGSTGCSSVSNVSTVNYVPGPTVTISESSSGGFCRNNTIFIGWGNQNITLTATSATAVRYLWSTGDTTQSINVTQPGTYSVVVWDAQGCSSPTSPPTSYTITADVVDVRCGHDLRKVILCHVPPGNPSNPQTICVAPSAIPWHLANHPGDCIGPCSLYYSSLRAMDMEEEVSTDEFYVDAFPNPFDRGFNLHVVNALHQPIQLDVYDLAGRLIETYSNVDENTILGEDLGKGIYVIEARQNSAVQRMRIVKN